MRALLHPLFADFHLHAERRAQRPSVSETVKTARGEQVAEGQVFFGILAQPGTIRRTECRYGRYEAVPALTAGPDNAGTARTEDPLVGAGHEKVTSKFCHGDVFYAKTVHTVNREPDPVGLATAAVQLPDGIRHPADGQLHSRRRVHKCDRNQTGGRPHSRDEAIGKLIGRGFHAVIVEGDPAYGRTAFLYGILQRHLRGVVVVGCGQDFVAALQLKSAVKRAQPLGGASGKGDLAGVGTDIGGSILNNPCYGILAVDHPVHGRVLVQFPHVFHDGIPDRFGM